MPDLVTVLREEDLKRDQGGAGLDLAPYLEIIDAIREQAGVGGLMTLEEGETQRTVKRRMSVAAQRRGLDLIWRKAPEGQLRFVLAEPGQRPPDARTRRPPAEPPQEQPAVDPVAAEDPAAAGGTTASSIGLEGPAQPRGRRRRRTE